MRIMTFNIQHALDYKNQVIDLPLFSDFIRAQNVDFCGLNEVRGEGNWEGYTDQTNTIGDLLNAQRYFAKAIMVAGTNPYGNAFVTIHPIKSAETVIIPDPEDKSIPGHYETRCAARAVVSFPEGDVCFIVCHMGLMESEARNAVRAICEMIDSTPLPCIVMGDFNHAKNSGVLDELLARLNDSDDAAKKSGVFTYPSYAPEKKIDYILYRGLKCTRCEVITEVVSDHFPVIAEFTF